MQSLRFRLITPFIVGTLLLTSLLSMYTYMLGSKSVQNATILISEAQVNQASNSVGVLLKSLNTSINNIAFDSHIKDIFINPSEEVLDTSMAWLNTVTSNNEYYREIFVVNRDGICIASSNPGHINASYTQEKYIQNALSGRASYGESSVGKVSLRFSASMAAPIRVEGKIEGALILQSDFSSIIEYSSRDSLNKQILWTSMLTPEGLFAAHQDKKLMANDSKLFPELYKELFEASIAGGAVEYTLQGVNYTGYAKLVPSNRWIIITSGKNSEIFSSSYVAGFTVLGINLFFLCVITFIVIRFSNGILRSLLSFIEYTKRVSDGDLDYELKAKHRNDELGILHTSLERLVFSLRAMLLETQKASKMKGEFLANMSHEIRTPLNAIIGIAHIILQEKDLRPRVQDFTSKIQISGHSLLGLINDILDISKVEAGMLELEIVPLNLREVISNALLIQQEQAKKKGIALIQDYPDDMPIYFMGDPLRTGQILNNLLGNALKFTTKGSVTIRCYLGSVPEDYTPDIILGSESAPLDAQCVYICVEDTGIGISNKTINSLFKPFVQADSSITRQFGGTGLGLTISERLVALLHGKFKVASTLGKGTNFTFFMQLAPATEEQSQDIANIDVNAAFKALDLSDKTLLVAEDNMINQLIMRELLKPTGAKIVMANNGQEAVDFLRENSADLVFMDLQMPILDGLQATKAIRGFLSSSELPIVAVTANAMKEDRCKGFEAGMNNYITKPISPKLLLIILRSFFSQK